MEQKYKVSWRADTAELLAQFGRSGFAHRLTDAEVIRAIKNHGRASINAAEELELFFENDYD